MEQEGRRNTPGPADDEGTHDWQVGSQCSGKN